MVYCAFVKYNSIQMLGLVSERLKLHPSRSEVPESNSLNITRYIVEYCSHHLDVINRSTYLEHYFMFSCVYLILPYHLLFQHPGYDHSCGNPMDCGHNLQDYFQTLSSERHPARSCHCLAYYWALRNQRTGQASGRQLCLWTTVRSGNMYYSLYIILCEAAKQRNASFGFIGVNISICKNALPQFLSDIILIGFIKKF